MLANRDGATAAIWLLLLLASMVLTVSCGSSASRKRDVSPIKSNGITLLESMPLRGGGHRQASLHRVRRTELSQAEIQEALNAHNTPRRQEGSSDMEIMKWNDVLASMADGWAQNCYWGHGQPSRNKEEVPYYPLGQNLYAISGTAINLTNAIGDWSREKKFYTYDTGDCVPGQMCGHYTQVVWAKSKIVGCGYAYCPELTNWQANANFLVCNYGPAGNDPTVKPFRLGGACTACTSGSFWCNNLLCDDACDSSVPSCACQPDCYNGATPDYNNCKCWCAPGWVGNDCSVAGAPAGRALSTTLGVLCGICVVAAVGRFT